MSAEEQQAKVDAVRAALRPLLTSDTARLRRWAGVIPGRDWPDYSQLCDDEDWTGLEERASEALLLYRRALQEMGRWQRTLRNTRRAVRSLEGLDRGWIPISTRPDVAQLRGLLIEELQSRGLQPLEVGVIMAVFDSEDRPRLARNARDAVGDAADSLTSFARSHLAAEAGAVLATSVAVFNRAAAGSTPRSRSVDIRTVAREARAHERDVWRCIRAQAAGEAHGAARRLQSFAERRVQSVAAANGRLAFARENSHDPALQQECLRLTNLTRELLRLRTVGRYVEWTTGWDSGDERANDLLGESANLPFASTYIQARRVSLRTLAARSEQFDQQRITVRGTISAFTVEVRPGKVVSEATLSDSQGASITLVLPYIRLDSGGIIVGAFVEATGRWYADSDEVAGSALQIGRRRYVELGQTGWQDWATLQIRDFYQPITQALEAPFTWQRGPIGACSQIRYRTWFAR